MSGKEKRASEKLLKWALLVLALYFVFQRLQQVSYQNILAYEWKNTAPILLGFVFLWLSNLALDAGIWKSLSNLIQRTKFKTAVQNNLISSALAFVTPINSGEVVGRYLMPFEKAKRSKVPFLIFWMHYGRLIAKLFVGSMAIGFLVIAKHLAEGWVVWLIWLLVVLLLGVVFFQFDKVQKWLSGWRLKSWGLGKYLIQNRPSVREKSIILGLSAAKFVVYNAQFVLLIFLWGNPAVSVLQVLASITVFYFISSFLPSIAMFDFVLKAAVAIYIISPTIADESLLINISFSLWLVNVALPAIVGMLLIFKHDLQNRIKQIFSRGSQYEL